MDTPYVRNMFLSSEIGAYIAAHTSPPDAIETELRAFTRDKLSNVSGMQIGDDQAVFMELLVRAIGARSAIEIGTFTGYSSIAIARGLGPEGHLICCDVSEEWTNVAREYWQRAGLSDRIELRIAPAADTLRALGPDVRFDFAFIDADKNGYLAYYEALIPLMRTHGLVLADNALQEGGVADPTNEKESVVAIREFNNHVARDERVTNVILPIGDGVTMIQKN